MLRIPRAFMNWRCNMVAKLGLSFPSEEMQANCQSTGRTNLTQPMKACSTLLVISVALLATSAFTLPASAADAPGKIKVLLVTGDDVMPAHNWREVSQAVREILTGSGKFEVRVCEDAGVLDSAATLGRYDLVFLQYYTPRHPRFRPGPRRTSPAS